MDIEGWIWRLQKEKRIKYFDKKFSLEITEKIVALSAM